MSKQIITHLEELWTKVEWAKKEWDEHLNSIPPGRCQNGRQELLLPPEDSISEARIRQFDRFRGSLQSRLDILSKLEVTYTTTLGTTRNIISRHLPRQPLGPETVNSVLLWTLNEVEDYLASVQKHLTALEQVITVRFARLRKNYKAVVKIVRADGAILELAIRLKDFMAVTEEIVENGCNGDGTFTKLAEALGDSRRQWDAIIGVMERQVLNFMRNMTLVGVDVPRQRLITEFFDG